MSLQYLLFHEDSCQIRGAHCLSLVQPAAVHATNKCVQTAQLEEGGKGEVHTINCRVKSELTLLHDLLFKFKDDRNELNFVLVVVDTVIKMNTMCTCCFQTVSCKLIFMLR